MTEIPEIDLRFDHMQNGQELGVASFLLEAEKVRQYRLAVWRYHAGQRG